MVYIIITLLLVLIFIVFMKKQKTQIIEKEIIKEIPIEIIKEVEKIIEKPIEIIKEIEVIKEVIKEVPVYKETKYIALKDEVTNDTFVEGNLVVKGYLYVNGEITCYKIKEEEA